MATTTKKTNNKISAIDTEKKTKGNKAEAQDLAKNEMKTKNNQLKNLKCRIDDI
jgi:hypothetical protein